MRHAVSLFLLSFAVGTGAATPSIGRLATSSGGRVGWARLVTPGSHWAVHSENDARLAEFIRTATTLNLDSRCVFASPAKLDDLCAYPLVYAKDLSALRDRDELKNVQQYLRRGGFICIDACTFAGVTPDTQAYFRANCDLLKQLIPGAEVRFLPPDHPIYRSYFTVREDELFTPDTHSFTKAQPGGLYGVFDGTRMLAIVSMHGLECGWPQAPLRAPGCMKMMVNIYVYAMTR